MKQNLSMNASLFASTVLCILVACNGCIEQPKQAADVAGETKTSVNELLVTARSRVVPDGTKAVTNVNAGDLQINSDATDEQVADVDPSNEEIDETVEEMVEPPEVQTIDIPKSWTRLSETHEIWVDMKAKKVIAAGHVVLRAGPLEMFICPRRTKEHESVISVNALSSEVHAALVAIGADPGAPVKWEPKYEPASGPIIDMTITWNDGEQLVTRRAQEMVRDFDTSKAITHDWVFGGSQTYTDPESGDSYYYGDTGELACVSNFSTATLDLNIESSDSNESLMFEAFTDNIPEIATKVYVEFKPRLD